MRRPGEQSRAFAGRPIGSGKAASGHSKALERQFVASEYKGCSEIGGVNSASA
jgi:hypothetical protein